MQGQIRCEECGQALDEDALMCWACGALTEKGREKREGMEDADEWIRAAEQARQRRQQEQEVDPDEALRQTLAQQGAVSELSRLDQEEATENFLDRTAYDGLREMDTALRYLGTGLSIILAFLFVITLGVAFSLIGDNGLVQPLVTAVLAVIMGVAALLIYYLLRFVAEVGRAVADTADNTRRAVVTARILRRHLEDKEEQENP
ncbi:MAG: hypothetical protein R6V19_02870 [Armatimonadota bacterium]